MNLKKLLICCVSFIVFYFGELTINIACGPEQDPYDYYVSFFHNNVGGDSYKPFAFNGMLFLNSEEDVVDEQQLNSASWSIYMGVKQRDVYDLFYKTDSATDIRLRNISAKNIIVAPDSLKRNSFLNSLVRKSSALRYYRFAKEIEPMVSKNADLWSTVQRDSLTMVKRAFEALRNSGQSSDQFLKLRYAYQGVRLLHYARNFEECKTAYQKFVEPIATNSPVKGWSLALYAGALRHTSNQVEAAYQFSKVFASNPERRIMAYRNYIWTDAKLQDVIELAKNDEEKANIYALNGFRFPDPNIEYLKEVYECNANSPLVAALLIREINKLEQNLLDKDEMAYDYVSALASNGGWLHYGKNIDSLKKANSRHLELVRDFSLKLANEKKYGQPDLGYIAAAYLSWMNQKESLALEDLKKVDLTRISGRLKDQYRLTELLIKAGQIKKGNDFNENELLPALKWLDEKRFSENKRVSIENDYDWEQNSNKKFTISTRNFYQQILAPAFAKKGDTAKAALAMLKGDLSDKVIANRSFKTILSYQSLIYWQQCLSEKTLRQLAFYKANSSLDNLQGFLSQALRQVKNDDFYELQGTSYLRAHQYANAIRCFNKLSKKFVFETPENWEYLANGKHIVHRLYPNAFAETVKDYPKKYLTKATGLNKKTFAQEMLRLEGLVKKDKKNAAIHYYRMANGLYQTGEFGNSWFLISYDSKVFINNRRAKYHYNGDYKLASKAKEYFLKAKNLSTSSNFKAKCTFMLARCEQKMILQTYEAIVWPETSDYDKQYKEQMEKYAEMNTKNPYFKEFKSQYANVPFYGIAVRECSILRDFLKGN